jgi:hypothetical protein
MDKSDQGFRHRSGLIVAEGRRICPFDPGQPIPADPVGIPALPLLLHAHRQRISPHRGNTKMNPNSLLVGCFLLASSAVALSSPSDGGAEARQAPSCGEWIVHREKSDTLALGNASWLLGYLSGMAISSGKDYLSGTDNSSIYNWMDNYCRKNPLRDLSSGGNALAAELIGKAGTPK